MHLIAEESTPPKLFTLPTALLGAELFICAFENKSIKNHE
jgi:hypothetical protein